MANDFPKPDGGQTMGGEADKYTIGHDGGSPVIIRETHTCPTCGSPLSPAFSMSGMWVNFTEKIKNRWICESGHIWDEPVNGFAWEH